MITKNMKDQIKEFEEIIDLEEQVRVIKKVLSDSFYTDVVLDLTFRYNNEKMEDRSEPDNLMEAIKGMIGASEGDMPQKKFVPKSYELNMPLTEKDTQLYLEFVLTRKQERLTTLFKKYDRT